MTIAEIISIGDEITIGKILDTNTQWLSRQLTELGVRVMYHTTVGDDIAAMLDVFRKAVSRADLVIATGGLGPTADDLTRQVIAEMMGVPLVQHDELLQTIRKLFESRGRTMPISNAIQACLPEGADTIPNPHGTAPGIDATLQRNGRETRLLALPGVPAEMREMWHDSVEQRITNRISHGQVIKSRTIHSFGLGESQVEQLLPNLMTRDHDPRVGITATDAVISLRIVAERESEAACDAAIEPVAELIYERLGDLIFGEDADTLPGVVVAELLRRNETLGTVEFGTGGMLSHDLALVPGSQLCYHGGLTNLPDEALHKMFVAEKAIQSAVRSQDTQADRALPEQRNISDVAASARRFFGTDHALVVGRYPDGGIDTNTDTGADKLVWLAHAHAKGVAAVSFPFGGHPALIDQLFVKRALDLLRRALKL